VAEGYPVQFALLSDINASDFIDRATVPIFKDPSGNLAAWKELAPGAAKHDTFVFSITGMRTLYWDASTRALADWSSDIRSAVETLGPQ